MPCTPCVIEDCTPSIPPMAGTPKSAKAGWLFVGDLEGNLASARTAPPVEGTARRAPGLSRTGGRSAEHNSAIRQFAKLRYGAWVR